MKRHIFNPADQQLDLNSKIIAGLERISEAFKALLWEKAKILRLSPIQIQILIFIKFHIHTAQTHFITIDTGEVGLTTDPRAESAVERVIPDVDFPRVGCVDGR